jgi:hypothetical protein
MPENNNDSHNSWDNHSLHLEESGSETQDDFYMAISSDDDAILKNLPSTQKSSYSTRRTQWSEKKSAKGVRGRQTAAQEVELSESDSETDPKTCGKWVIIYL